MKKKNKNKFEYPDERKEHEDRYSPLHSSLDLLKIMYIHWNFAKGFS